MQHPGYAPPPGGFGPSGGPFEPPAPQFNPLAITSMVLGILSMPTCCCGFLGAPLAIAALVMGLVSLDKIQRDPRSWKGGGMAIAGIVTGGIGLFFELAAFFMAFDDSMRSRWCFGSFF